MDCMCSVVGREIVYGYFIKLNCSRSLEIVLVDYSGTEEYV
jgi:hypothetical protein